ncbi:T-kininogen 1-like [Hyla sarda]|uniref:T-kininogen 1-like n=1 Tax=Hyla sarda TaxID=327740 RepID=UPI0024C328AB|nr:T-kininogen 1-like [Hyla sarda]
MMLLPFLLFCLYCLLGSATVIDDDCNDQNVFNAVDEALRSYNNVKEDGNLFILYRITEAKIKNEDGQANHFVEYEAHESSCKVKSGKSWQECSSANAHQVKCSAHIFFNQHLKLGIVESQNCTSPEVWPTETAVHHQCLGCPQLIDNENKELLCFVHSTIEQLNNDANHPFYFDLDSIVNATRKVVFGWTYNINFLIRQTNCSKLNFTSKNSNECKIDNEEKSIECSAEVNVSPDDKVNYQFLQCISETGVCINCPVVINPEDPEIRALLVQVMDEFNINSNHSKLYNVAFINTATKKGFHRQLYEVTFTIGLTNCSKSDYSILGDECDVIEETDRFTCTTKINITDKRVNVHSAPYCRKELSVALLRISGLSPLRVSRNINHEHDDGNHMLRLLKPVKKIEQEKESQPLHVKKHKHGKKDKEEKNKHKYKHQESSEEEEEDNNDAVPQDPLQAPKVSNSQDRFPNTEKESVLDLPQPPTDVVPRCPGRVWQPKILIATIPTFGIDDLALALDDLSPSSDQDKEVKEPLTIKQTLDFNDEDLLG